MAAQAADNLGTSVQREPSMEEILASIRRIIEDSDGVKADTQIPEPANNSAAPAQPVSDPYRRAVEPAIQRHEPFAEMARTVEDYAREEMIASEPASTRMPEPAITRTDEPLVSARSFEPEFDVQAPQVRPETPAPTEPAPAPTVEVETSVPAADVFSLEDDAFAEIESLVETAISAPSTPTPAKSNIISEVAGRQVAAAFGELTEAFAATRRRSFDEVAEEMMRPMLQEWLDNNLPTLVEKLVREEIERIARAG